MPKINAVLDACVLIPQYLRDTLLSTAWQDLYCPYWSEEILGEATRNLMSQYNMTQEKAINQITKIKNAFLQAMVEVPPGLINIMQNDPKDRHVLAAAVVAKASVIVTNNLDDFPPEALALWGVEAQSPDKFLTNLFDDYPGEVVQVIQQQSQKYKKPKKTLIKLLDFLSKKAGLTKFVGKILLYEYGLDIVQAVEMALSNFGKLEQEGGKFLEGESYRIWQRETSLAVIAKDGRGEILRLQNNEIEGNLSADDVQAFQVLKKSMNLT